MTTITDATEKQFDAALLAEADVVVIGGGIIGTCTAYYLAKLGQRVMLCEKGIVAGEQSSRNWGWVRQHGRDEAELPIMMESNRLWQGLAQELGEDLGFRQHGVLYLASTEEKLAQREKWLDLAKRFQLESKLLNAAQVSDLTGAPATQWCGGVYTPNDGRAEPWIATSAIARGAQKLGVSIKEHCAVRSLEQSNSQITGVVTEHGIIKCNRVVLAAGAWSGLFAGNMNIDLPQLTIRSTVVQTTPVPNFFNGNAADEQLAFRRREDGGYSLALTDQTEHLIGPNSFKYLRKFSKVLWQDLSSYNLKPKQPAHFPDAWRTSRRWDADAVSPFEKQRVLNPAPNKNCVDKLVELGPKKLPGLIGIGVAHSWAGMIDTMPDIVPVIDTTDSSDSDTPNGLTIATGFSGHGFGIGPAAGKLVADSVCQKPVAYDLTRFRFSRFSDGSSIELGPAI